MAQEKLHTHYDNLKVARNAPAEVIKAAYRILSQRYHPDRNPGKADAHRVMALVNESYRILSDPKARAAHDDWIAEEESSRAAQALEDGLAQQHYAHHANRPSAATKRQRESAEPDVPPSQCPAHEPERGKEAAYGYSRFNEEQRQHHRQHFKPESERRAEWGPPIMGLAVLLLLIVAASTVTTTSSSLGRPSPAESIPAPHASAKTTEPDIAPVRHLPTPPGQAAPQEIFVTPQARNEFLDKIIMPPDLEFGKSAASSPHPAPTLDLTHAPNGFPWPAGGGYLTGYDLGAHGGRSSITVNNSKVGTPAHVQLFRLTTGKAERHLLVAAYGTQSLEGIQPGTYEIRFKFLGEPAAYASERIVLQEVNSFDGTQFDDVTMTLYKVRGGNMHTRTLPKGEF